MNKATDREFTGRHMLMVTGAFFGVIITVNAVMAISASTTWTGLVVANSYVASQEFQVKADAIRAQHEAGWGFGITYQDGTLLVQSTGATTPPQLADVSAFVHRPVGGHEDTTIILTPSPRGYEGHVDLPSGVWDVAITTGPTALGVIEREARITVP